MSQITYQPYSGSKTTNLIEDVFLDGKKVGAIRSFDEGYRYCPVGTKIKGEPFATLAECKASLEDDA
ncbi:hypothetical protein vBCbaSRXM_49 [Citromicrobium phage vB_CbaS-RXM]|nr:hypothetical protein vBCbaSRXM_49 [Citromicrobium phage vB_CbaS-RXM]